MNVGFERIEQVPGYPTGVTAVALIGLSWASKANVVVAFKNGLKKKLRTAQLSRCCFCRRLLYDDYSVHLEHFLDKATHETFRFEIRNLALSCGTCNGHKNGYFSTWISRYKRLNKTPHATATPILKRPLNAGDVFPMEAADFRWVNPYIHNYSNHIVLSRGWVFTGLTPVGRRTVRGCGMNKLADIERRALEARLETRGGLLSMMVGAIAECNQHRAREIADVVVRVVSRRRQMR